MKKIFLIAIVALLCFSVFAQAQSEKAAAETKDVTLEWWTWDPEMIEQNKSIIAAFEAQNPGVKVNNTIVDSKEYWTKLRIQAQQKRLPDVFTLSSGYIEEWASEGLLRNLDDLVKNDPSLFENFYQPIWDVTKSIAASDHYYAIPFALVNTVLYYNKDMFDQAGIAYPTDDWTWDQFLDAAKKLTVDKDNDGKIDQYGFWFYGRYAHAESFVFANNGSFVDRKTMRFAPDANAQKALRMLTDMVLVDKSAPAQQDMSALKNQQVFPNGLCAMWVDGGWYINDFKKKSDLHWGIVRVPQGPDGGKRVTYAWPDSYALSPNTAHPEEAWKFAKFVAGEGLTLDQFMAGKIPAYKGLTESEAFLTLAGEDHRADMQLLKDMASDEMTTSYTKGWSEWRGYGAADSMGLNGTIDGIINGKVPYDKAMADAETSINKVLSRYYK